MARESHDGINRKERGRRDRIEKKEDGRGENWDRME
jgi:hypothetical protein